MNFVRPSYNFKKQSVLLCKPIFVSQFQENFVKKKLELFVGFLKNFRFKTFEEELILETFLIFALGP